eukprot:TRINITY_DN5390_c0_g1_i1.p2 TRINITY_DN5390_c0_g1~~TRINITY_DN5390_c0_g1_i1.p2  ORF type:complete len:155 (+),score=32.40 TRINITY_DN5390_c0_g1_i1:29-466(+)
MERVVQLNVGGVHYDSTVATLCTKEGVLKDIMNGKASCIWDGEGRVFIDSDGLVFGHILNYLRHGYFSIPPTFTDYPSLHQSMAYLFPALPLYEYPRPPLSHSIQSPDRLNNLSSHRGGYLPAPHSPYAKVGLQLQHVEDLINKM